MTLHHGDCLDVMAAMGPESVDAIVTDPPYGLEFMGKEWDRLDAGLPQEQVWKGRRGQGGGSVKDDDSKPASRHHVSFGGGQHGFKRCQKCGKRAFSGSPCQCAEPEWVVEYAQRAPSSAIRMGRWHQQWAEAAYRIAKPSAYLLAFGGTRTVHRMTCALEDAGWIIRDMLVWGYASGFPKSKASLKPAWEPIVMARKPGPLRMLAIDECRIPSDDGFEDAWDKPVSVNAKNIMVGTLSGSSERKTVDISANKPVGGRWPANIVLTDPIFDGGIEGVVGGGETGPASDRVRHNSTAAFTSTSGAFEGHIAPRDSFGFSDTGTYSRFFLIPKAARSDREPVLGGQLDLGERVFMGSGGRTFRDGEWHETHSTPRQRENSHPTVKPTDLMRHLVRLVTPTGGIVLDPFLGSGTTALAAEMEGFEWIGIEREAEYVAIAEARLNGTQRGLGLVG